MSGITVDPRLDLPASARGTGGESLAFRAARWAFSRLSPGALDALDRAAIALSQRVQRRLAVELFTAEHPALGRPVRIAVAGYNPAVAYQLEPLVGPDAQRTPADRAPLRRLQDALRRHADADLFVARVPRRVSDRHFDDNWLRLPESVACTAELDAAGELAHRHRKSTTSNRNRVQQSGLNWRTTRSPADLHRFYDDYYLPFTSARFGAQACPRSRLRLARAVHRGGLMWVTHEGRDIYGCVFDVRGDTLHLISSGTLQGSNAYDHTGVLSAHYVFAAELLAHLGLRRVDFGACRACIGDGILLHKKRWGCGFSVPALDHHDLLVSWPRCSDLVLRMLRDRPPILRTPGQPGRLWALAAADREGDAGRTAALLAARGVDSVVLVGDGEASAAGGGGVRVVPRGSPGELARAVCTG